MSFVVGGKACPECRPFLRVEQGVVPARQLQVRARRCCRVPCLYSHQH
jgi:hypothetical protein